MPNPTAFQLSGLTAATHTPFHADGTLNLGVIEHQAAHLLNQNISTAFIGGSTGECHSLTCHERVQLTQRWSEVTRGTALRVVVHVGSNCLADCRTLAAQAQQLQAAAISALAPSYFKPRSVSVLVDWCAEIAAMAPATPFYYYDIPSMTNVGFPMRDFLQQAAERIPNLAGIKFTNQDLMSYQLCLNADGGRFDIPWGVDEALLGALALGARGAIGSSYNFAAPIYQRLISAFRAGDLTTAQAMQGRSVKLIQCLSREGYMGASKALMELLGPKVGPPRLPIQALTAEQSKQLRTALEPMGFFDWIANC